MPDRALEYDSRYQSVPNAGKFGMFIFLAALTMLFGASIIGYLIIRSRAPEWPPAGLRLYSNGLWFSTALIVVSSIAMHMAYIGAKTDNQRQLRVGMLLTTILGTLFLAAQTWNWYDLIGTSIATSDQLFGFTFYMLTGLHALHVIGGILPLAFVTRRAYAGRYDSEYHPGVVYCSMYWHFLTGMWIVIFTMLVLGSRGGTGAPLDPGIVMNSIQSIPYF